MGDFGDLDTAGEQVVNQGYTNCRLISVEVDSGYSSVSNADKPVLVKTYETLTDSFVQITDDTVDFTESGLKQITRVYRAISGKTSSNVVGTTALNTGEILASSKIEDNDAFAELTETYVEAGVLSISESHRYGDSVEVYSVEGIKLTQEQARAAITDLPQDAKFYGLRLSNYEGLQTTLYEFFTGSGVISTSISYSYNNKLTRTTIVSIDETPDTPAGSVLIDSKAEARDEFILYTYTFVKGQGIVSTNSSSKYDGKLIVTTVTSINQVPTVPAGSTTIEAQVREEDGYLLYTTTYASGAGVIGVSTDTKYDGKLTLTTTTSLNEPPTGITNLIRSESSQSDYGTIYTYTTVEGTGEIGRSTDSKYNGTLTLTTVTSINAVPDEDGALVRSDVNETDYGTIYTYTYASGQGQIAQTTDKKYNNKLILTTVTTLNQAPSGNGALIRSDVNNTDYGTIYTYTYATGAGEIGRSTDKKYNNTLNLVTVTSLNEPPSEGGYLFKSDTTETDYGTIYTYTYASGEGQIGISTDIKYQGKLQIKTITSLNEIPTTPPTFATIGASQDSGDFGIVYTYRYAKGEGQISTTEQTRGDGSIVNSYTILGNEDPQPPANSYLIEKSHEAGEGYDIYTYYYYRLPEDYDVPVSTTWTKPSTLGFNETDGFFIQELGTIDPVTGTAEVRFSTTQPMAVPLADVDISCWTRENVKYEDGTRLVRSGTFQNTVSNEVGAAFNNGSYLGEAVTSLTCTSGGPEMPSGEIVIGWETVPYFYAGGTIVYKTTTTRVTV
jgi:hypothetical protein